MATICARRDRGACADHDAVRVHARKGGLVMACCNGFQILCESELLPGVC